MPSRRRPHAVLSLALAITASIGLAACTGSSSSPPTSSVPVAPTSGSPAALPWPEPGTAALPAATTEVMQAAMDSWVSAGHLAGATAAVVTPAGRWALAAGVDGAGRRLPVDAAMWIASITKTYTAAEVMMLVQRGLVDLDRPLTDYVDVPFETGGATVRQVLAMRSGFPELPQSLATRLIAADLARDWSVPEVLAALPADAPRAGSLGGTPRYNNLNYLLLEKLVSMTTIADLGRTVRDDLLAPAGLERTWAQTSERPTAALSVGTNPPGPALVAPAGPWLPSRSLASFAGGGGAMAADAEDVARWGYLLYGGHVVDPTLVAQMEADPQEDPEKGLYALGTMEATDDDGTLIVGHAGGGPDFPYTALLLVWTGATPVAVAVLAPQPADVGADLAPLAAQLRTAASA